MTKFEIAQIITAVAASLTALVALLLSIYEGRSNRKHNRLSLKPRLVMSTSKSNNPTRVTAKIVNAGLGTAVIEKMTISIDGQEIEGDLEEEFKAVIKKLTGKLKTAQSSSSIMNSGFVLRAAQESQLVHLELHPDESCTPKELEGKFETLDVKIKFSSFYGEHGVYDSAKS